MKSQVSDSNAHVVENAIGEADGDGHPQQSMRETKRNDAAVAAKHLAEKQSADESAECEDGAGQVRGGKHEGGGHDRGTAAEQRFQTQVEERLQDEFLQHRPDCVLPGRMP